MKGTLSVLRALICALIVPFCVVPQTPAPTESPEIQRNEAGLVHFGDVIDVDFAGTLEYDWRGTLKSDGSLDGVDQFSPIPGLCRSETEIAADAAHAYSKILREPIVTVRIVDRSGRAVARLDGAVKMPTRFRIHRPVRLKELIVAAGGFTDDVSGEIAILRRHELNCTSRDHSASEASKPDDANVQAGNRLQIMNIAIGELLSGEESANPFILSGDAVTVGKAVPVFVIGAVNNPKPVYSHSRITSVRAIATAGGLAKGAVSEKAVIFRHEGSNRTVIQVDLEKIKNGELNDVELKPFDIIEVAFKGRAPRKYPPVIATSDNRDRGGSDLPLRIID